MFLTEIKEFLSLLNEEFPPKEQCRHAIFLRDDLIHAQMAFPSELVHLVISQDEEDDSPELLFEKIRDFLKDKKELLYDSCPKDSGKQLCFDF